MVEFHSRGLAFLNVQGQFVTFGYTYTQMLVGRQGTEGEYLLGTCGVKPTGIPGLYVRLEDRRNRSTRGIVGGRPQRRIGLQGLLSARMAHPGLHCLH